RAEIAQNHKRGSAAVEAFVDIRAARRFADSMQIQRAQTGFETVQRFEMRGAAARPFRQAGPRERIDLNQRLIHKPYFCTKALAKPSDFSFAFASATSAV